MGLVKHNLETRSILEQTCPGEISPTLMNDRVSVFFFFLLLHGSDNDSNLKKKTMKRGKPRAELIGHAFLDGYVSFGLLHGPDESSNKLTRSAH